MSKQRPYWHVENVLRGQDSFANKVPAFNIDGNSTINTVLGGFLSTMIFSVVAGYAIGTLLEVF